MKVVADTGPLLAAAYHNDPAHQLAKPLVTAVGRDLIVLDTVLVEADHLLRRRSGAPAARSLWPRWQQGEHAAAFLTPGLFARATEIDAGHADLALGLVDASVMAYAERHDLPILTSTSSTSSPPVRPRVTGASSSTKRATPTPWAESSPSPRRPGAAPVRKCVRRATQCPCEHNSILNTT